MRLTLVLFATALVALGFWLLATGLIADGPLPTTVTPQLAAPPQTTAGPIALGLALLVGGGFLFVLVLRRRA